MLPLAQSLFTRPLLTPAPSRVPTGAPTFASQLHLLSTRDFLTKLAGMPKGLVIETPALLHNTILEKPAAATFNGSEGLIIGAQTPTLKSLFHVLPEFRWVEAGPLEAISPEAAARNIAHHVQELSETAKAPVDIFITGGNFKKLPPTTRQLLLQRANPKGATPSNPDKPQRHDITRDLFEALKTELNKNPVYKTLRIAAGKKHTMWGNTGLLMQPNDSGFYLNQIKGNDYNKSNGMETPKHLSHYFEELDLIER